MNILSVNMDFYHDAEMKHYLRMWKNNPCIELLYSDVRELSLQGLSALEIKERIRQNIDQSHAMLVIAGEWANDREEMPNKGGIIYKPEDIDTLNWQHYGLQYFVEQNKLRSVAERKKIRGIKLFEDCQIPYPLHGIRGLYWRVLKGKRYRDTLLELFPPQKPDNTQK